MSWGEMDTYLTGTGQKLWVHKANEDCFKYGCVIHSPSNHAMKDFPINWREDRNLMERICPHGIGHPDPDDLNFKYRKYGKIEMKYEAIHGCDGCCAHNDKKQKSKE